MADFSLVMISCAIKHWLQALCVLVWKISIIYVWVREKERVKCVFILVWGWMYLRVPGYVICSSEGFPRLKIDLFMACTCNFKTVWRIGGFVYFTCKLSFYFLQMWIKYTMLLNTLFIKFTYRNLTTETIKGQHMFSSGFNVNIMDARRFIFS